MSLEALHAKLYTDLATIANLNVYTEPQDANKIDPSFCSVKWLGETPSESLITAEVEFLGIELDLYVGIEIDTNNEALKRTAGASIITLSDTIIAAAEIKTTAILFSDTVIRGNKYITMAKISGQILL